MATSGLALVHVQPLVTSYEDSGWILWQVRPHVLVFNAFLDEANPQFQEWAYFNYLIYDLVLTAAGSSARQTTITKDTPVDAVIMAVIDSLEVEGKVVFRKS